MAHLGVHGEACKVKHIQRSARGEAEPSSSYLEDGSKPGLNRTLWLPSCKGPHIETCVYQGGVLLPAWAPRVSVISRRCT